MSNIKNTETAIDKGSLRMVDSLVIRDVDTTEVLVSQKNSMPISNNVLVSGNADRKRTEI